MQKKKTRFEQVPTEIAENALRLGGSRSNTIANGNGNLWLRNPAPIRAGSRHLRRRRRYR
jgi:hypothetical protein